METSSKMIECTKQEYNKIIGQYTASSIVFGNLMIIIMIAQPNNYNITRSERAKRTHSLYTCMTLRINLLINDQYVATDMINIIIIAKFFRLRIYNFTFVHFYTYTH